MKKSSGDEVLRWLSTRESALALLASLLRQAHPQGPPPPARPQIHESTARPPPESPCAHGGWRPPSPALGLPVRVPGHGHHLLLARDFGVLEDAVPHHTGRPDLLAAAEEVGHRVHTALDVGASQEAGTVAAHPLQPPEDQVGLPGRQEGTVMKLEEPRSKGQGFKVLSKGQRMDEGFLSQQFSSCKCDIVNTCSKITLGFVLNCATCAKSEREDNFMDTKRGGGVGWIER